jgi:hypothetical protein
LKIVASQSLGALGSGQSAPTYFQWRWYHHLPILTVWLAAVVFVVLWKGDRKSPAWRLVAAIVLTVVLVRMDGVRLLFLVLLATWLIVWLVGRRRAPREQYVVPVVVAEPEGEPTSGVG